LDLVAEVWVPGMGLYAVVCEEAGNAVVGVDAVGSLVVCLQPAFGVEVERCRGLEGMGCRVDYEPVKSAAPREVEASLGVQQLSSSCVVEGDGHWLTVEVVKALLAGLTRVEVV
jgi:hypothetical protein